MDFPNDVHICHITCAIEKGYSIAIKTLKQENSNTIVNVLIILGTSTSVSKQQYFSESSTASTSSAPTFTRPLTPNSRSTGIGKTSAPKTGGSHAKAPSTAKLSSSSLSSSLPSLINGSTKTISNQSSSAKPTLLSTHMKTTGTTPETTITSSSHATSLSFPTPSATAHPSTAVLATKPTSDNRPAETADDKNNDEDKSSVPATQGTGIAWSALLPHSCNFNLTLSDQTRHVGITAWSTDNSFLNMLPSTVDISKIVQFHTYLKHEEAIKSRIRNEATAVCVLSDDDNNVSDGLTKKLSSDYAFATGPCNETFDLAFTSQLSAMGDWLLESMSPSVNASFAAAASNGQPLFILSACRKAPVNSVSSSSFAPAPTPQISSQSQDPVRKRKIARLLLLDDDDDG